MDRAGGWERDVLHSQVPEHPNPQVAGTQYFAMDVDEVTATGSRPDRLAGVRPQERVQQHFVDQFVDTTPVLPILDVPVPLMEERVGALGHVGWLVLAEPGLAALPVASALGGVAVEVPQIQFIDAVVLEQFQFLDQFMVGSWLCNDSCRCSLGCSTLTSVDVLA